ncbi:MAG: hypothetical protein RLZZ347_420 [Candidatus Parcubacteria bacterium]|jgi:prepilin-type N-terminal cleavage/methylation domain-containing protein
MESLKTYIHSVSVWRGVDQRGFTITEMLIVVGIITMFIGVSLFVDMNQFRGDAFRTERTTIITLLQTARANAMNNVNQTSHGVALFPANHPNSYVLFQGVSYATADPTMLDVMDAQYGITFSTSSPKEIVFTQLSGNANYAGNITLNDPQRGMSLPISVNYEGRISW